MSPGLRTDPAGLELREVAVVPIAHRSAVARARRMAVDAAKGSGFDDDGAARVGLGVTEAGTNIVKHAGKGVIFLHALDAGPNSGVEVVAVDQGPGMADVSRSSRDGTSSTGTLGLGLGGLRRLADEFDLHSAPDRGTVVVLRFWAGARARARVDAGVELGAVNRPVVGEPVSGDAVAVDGTGTGVRVLLADGLGHGPLAHVASQRAVDVFETAHGVRPEEVIERAHRAMRSTRGAAVAVVHVLPRDGVVRFAGVGNIGAAIVDTAGERHGFLSSPGIVGHQFRSTRAVELPFGPDDLLVMHSDGIASRWNIEPGLHGRHPALVAGTLLRDAGRDRDDAAVAVLRRRGPSC